MCTSGQEAPPNIWQWSGGPTGSSGVVGRPSRMIESGWESLQEVWEALLDVQEWLGGPPRCP